MILFVIAMLVGLFCFLLVLGFLLKQPSPLEFALKAIVVLFALGFIGTILYGIYLSAIGQF